MKIFYTILFAFFIGNSIFAQSVNNYKYVLVPNQFEFLKSPDEFQVNSLTVFLFKKYGFDAYKGGLEAPAYVLDNRCDVLYADVIGNSGFLRTKLKVVLRDCNNIVVYTSEEGDSKDKRYKESYHEALREAFLSIEALNYKYEPGNDKKTTSSDTAETEMQSAISKPDDKKEIQEVIEVPDINKEHIDEIVTNADSSEAVRVFVSENSDYKLVQAGGNFIVFDGTKEIGAARLKNSNVFLVETTDFSGEGRISGDEFLINREIKGVGMVTMRFIEVN
ncbi:hypothetical protein EAX61_04325 [Dokdonia sinensis]|uniref:Uncharacterized protein n=1 Tax=Dokdonia sinensis TaxID=2479847 RepID=A0A3M0GJJ7_9FLAO|nr:hypothetical protein [Dokdonia sinensis]RMB62812.1 hypothetical protein EAX61_04325 [Dokdonia sinensis]